MEDLARAKMPLNIYIQAFKQAMGWDANVALSLLDVKHIEINLFAGMLASLSVL